MEHYVIICDGGFLPQALALHRSLRRHGDIFRLWVLALDDGAFDAIGRLALPDLTAIALDDVLTDTLRSVRPTRSRAEFCWTLTPQVFDMVFAAAPDAARVTYIDADLWFRSSPAPILAEFERSGKAVLITEHAYATDHDQSDHTGRYCVQFVTCRREGSQEILAWWAERCLEWCYARFEDGKFGDQKYLDDWETRFSDAVHVLQDQERILGPWSAERFPFARASAIHFHGLRLLAGGRVLLSRGYAVPRSWRRGVYAPYLKDLSEACKMLTELGLQIPVQAKRPGPIVFAGVLMRRIGRWLSRTRPYVIAKLAKGAAA